MSQPLDRCQRAAGFTLIELLVVVSIIAVLAALLLPALSKARSRTLTFTCCTNLKQVALALYNYREEQEGYLPIKCNNTGPGPGDPYWNYYALRNYLSPYLESRAKTEYLPILKCPADAGFPAQYGTASSYAPVAYGGGAQYNKYGGPSNFWTDYSLRSVGEQPIEVHSVDGVTGQPNINNGLFGGTSEGNLYPRAPNPYIIEVTAMSGVWTWNSRSYAKPNLRHGRAYNYIGADLGVRSIELTPADFIALYGTNPGTDDGNGHRIAGNNNGYHANWPYRMSTTFAPGLIEAKNPSNY